MQCNSLYVKKFPDVLCTNERASLKQQQQYRRQHNYDEKEDQRTE